MRTEKAHVLGKGAGRCRSWYKPPLGQFFQQKITYRGVLGTTCTDLHPKGAPGKKPRPLQLSRHRLLRQLGFKVYVLDDESQIGGMIDEIRAT